MELTYVSFDSMISHYVNILRETTAWNHLLKVQKMFFCAGFFNCFLIVNQTKIGCKKQCKDLHADIPGISEHSFFDTARELLEQRQHSGRPDAQHEKDTATTVNKDLIKSKSTRIYTDLVFNFTSKKWSNAREAYTYDNITWALRPTTYPVKFGSIDFIGFDVLCRRNFRASPHDIILLRYIAVGDHRGTVYPRY